MTDSQDDANPPTTAEGDGSNVMQIEKRPGASNAELLAEALLQPTLRNAHLTAHLAHDSIGGPRADLTAAHKLTCAAVKRVNDGDLVGLQATLTSQAMTLDAIFTSTLARSINNMGKYPEAAERYMRMALKAQSQARVTVETLAKVVRGNEQVVKHVYVDNRGGQAIIGETVHASGRGGSVAENVGPPHEPSAALPRPNAPGIAMPVSGDQGEGALPTSRRPIHRRTERKP